MTDKSAGEAARPRPGRLALRRHLIELGFGLTALAITLPLAKSVLWESTVKADTGQAHTVISRDMLQSVNTTNECTHGRVALTFDDGPDLYTPQVLQVLRAFNVKATFYVMGKKATAHPELIRAEVADGNLVENHSWNHPHMADLTAAEINQQLTSTEHAIIAAGAPPPTLFRPPFGNTNGLVDAAAHRLGLRVVRWSIDTNDWRGRASNDIAASVLDQVVPGAVVLMHDGVTNSAATVQALPVIIRGLRTRGFCTALGTE